MSTRNKKKKNPLETMRAIAYELDFSNHIYARKFLNCTGQFPYLSPSSFAARAQQSLGESPVSSGEPCGPSGCPVDKEACWLGCWLSQTCQRSWEHGLFWWKDHTWAAHSGHPVVLDCFCYCVEHHGQNNVGRKDLFGFCLLVTVCHSREF